MTKTKGDKKGANSVKREQTTEKDGTDRRNGGTDRGRDGDLSADTGTPKDFGDLENGEEGEEEDEEEEEEEPPEMTQEERKEMHQAVKDGDIDLLEDLLEKPNADIRMVFFDENLLMTALRARQLQMAEFLLDNGVDQDFATTLMNPGSHQNSNKPSHKVIEVFQYSCRQMAYDKGYMDIVEIIDILNGRLFPGIKPRERIPRYRRPPPTPVSVSDDSDTSTSSGDESDVSGEMESRQGGGEDTSREPISSRTASTFDRGEDEIQANAKRKKKKMKKKKKSEDQAETDGGVPSEDDPESQREKSRKHRHKSEDKSRSADYEDQEDGFPGRKSGSSGGQGDLTERSRATTKSSEQTGDGDTVVNDEGYETMSPSPSPAARMQQMQPQAPRFQPPSIPVKPTKAFLALRRTVETHQQRCISARYNEARPLHWRKVKSTGSYEVESPLWHQASSSLPPKLPPPTPSGTATTTPASSLKSEVQSRSSGSTSIVSTIEISNGNVTKPKILHPSQRVNSSKSLAATLSNSSGVSGTNSTSTTSKSSATDRLYPLKLKVPSYMRMTTSCFVKRRLEPSFTNTYGSLDFVEPCPKGFSSARGTGETISKSSRAGEEGSTNVARKPVPSPLSSRTASGFTSVIDISSSPTLSRKKAYGMGGSSSTDVLHRRLDSVPSIRNNSSVFHTPKLSSVPSKIR